MVTKVRISINSKITKDIPISFNLKNTTGTN